MACLLISILILSMATHSSGTWCVCKKGGDEKVLQQAIDYACGNGADCSQTHQGGKCFNPDTVMDHCNYAVNSYFQKKAQTPEACIFKGAAMVTSTDPSSNGCTYPTSASSGTTGSTTSTHSPGSIPTTSFGNNSPTNTGVLGGGMGSLGPSASSMDTDVSHGGMRLRQLTNVPCSVAIMGAAIVMLTWG